MCLRVLDWPAVGLPASGNAAGVRRRVYFNFHQNFTDNFNFSLLITYSHVAI